LKKTGARGVAQRSSGRDGTRGPSSSVGDSSWGVEKPQFEPHKARGREGATARVYGEPVGGRQKGKNPTSLGTRTIAQQKRTDRVKLMLHEIRLLRFNLQFSYKKRKLERVCNRIRFLTRPEKGGGNFS